MSMYNLIEYSKHYSKATESLCNYCRDEPNSGTVRGSISSYYKTSITGKLTI